MPRCAWLLIGALTLLLHHTVGLTFALELTTALAVWAATTPAALIAIAALAFWHLANEHPPRTARART